MNSQQLLYINIVLGIVFVLYFLLGRGNRRGPTKLNVKANEDFTKSVIKTQQIQSETVQEKSHPPKMTVLEPENENVINLKSYATKNLSIYFVYNGHEWEAHEVLGVPAGSALPQVTEAYQKLIITSDPSTFEFYESSYQAILKRRKDRL